MSQPTEPTTQPTQQADLLGKVLAMAQRLAGPYDLAEMLSQIIDAARSVLLADRGAVFLYDDATRELYLKTGTGIEELRFCVDQGIAGQCACSRKVINVEDCYADPRFNPEVDRQTGYRTHSLLAAPLVGLDNRLVGVMQILNPTKGRFDETDEIVAEMFASHAAVAIQRAVLLEERLVKLKLERDLQLARKIQMNVLPIHPPSAPGYDLAGFSRPAEQAGGDIYDLTAVTSPQADNLREANNLFILLADATGHGVGPAISVTQVRAMLRVGLKLGADLDSLLTHINNQLTEDLAAERFVTAFVGLLDVNRHELIYHAPGQGPLLHYQAADNRFQWLPASTFPLGIISDAPMQPPTPIRLAPNDWLVLLTDGFYEYMNAAKEQFGQKRIGEVVGEHQNGSAQQLLDALLVELNAFADGAEQLDDLTAVLIKRTK